MNIVMASSEASPWIKTGGLGDVLEALPQEIAHIDENSVTLFLPYYKTIKNNTAFHTEKAAEFYISFSLRKVYVGVERLLNSPEGIVVYFIDNNDYFWRDNPYGYFDDGERFAFFSNAILEACSRLSIPIDIFHCHDWQTALVPVLLHAKYWNEYCDVKTVLTIHNLQYQGWANPDFLNVILDIGEEWRNVLTFDGGINFLKAGIEEADIVTTVSKTYAEEILTPSVGGRISGFLSERSKKIMGIVNGINMQLFSPESCSDISTPFSQQNYEEGKRLSKLSLQKELGLKQCSAVPVMSIVTRLADHKGIDILCESAETILTECNSQLVVCGTGDRYYERILTQLASRYPDRCAAYIGFSPSLANRIYAGSDMYLMPSHSEPCGLSQLIAMRFGAVPVVHSVGGLRDTVLPYDPVKKDGRGFTYDRSESGAFVDAVKSACDLYRNFPDDWSDLCRNNMREDFSWKKPAREYLQLYRSIL